MPMQAGEIVPGWGAFQLLCQLTIVGNRSRPMIFGKIDQRHGHLRVASDARGVD